MKKKNLWIVIGVVTIIAICAASYLDYAYNQEQAAKIAKQEQKEELQQGNWVIKNVNRYLEGDYDGQYSLDGKFRKIDRFLRNEIKTLNTLEAEAVDEYASFIENEYYNSDTVKGDMPNFITLKGRIREITKLFNEKEKAIKDFMSSKNLKEREKAMNLTDEEYDIYKELVGTTESALYKGILGSFKDYKLDLEYDADLLDCL
ncbi:MAG: hypothetical protein RR441_12000, partial [Longicatena sp.]